MNSIFFEIIDGPSLIEKIIGDKKVVLKNDSAGIIYGKNGNPLKIVYSEENDHFILQKDEFAITFNRDISLSIDVPIEFKDYPGIATVNVNIRICKPKNQFDQHKMLRSLILENKTDRANKFLEKFQALILNFINDKIRNYFKNYDYINGSWDKNEIENLLKGHIFDDIAITSLSIVNIKSDEGDQAKNEEREIEKIIKEKEKEIEVKRIANSLIAANIEIDSQLEIKEELTEIYKKNEIELANLRAQGLILEEKAKIEFLEKQNELIKLLGEQQKIAIEIQNRLLKAEAELAELKLEKEKNEKNNNISKINSELALVLDSINALKSEIKMINKSGYKEDYEDELLEITLKLYDYKNGMEYCVDVHEKIAPYTILKSGQKIQLEMRSKMDGYFYILVMERKTLKNSLRYSWTTLYGNNNYSDLGSNFKRELGNFIRKGEILVLPADGKGERECSKYWELDDLGGGYEYMLIILSPEKLSDEILKEILNTPPQISYENIVRGFKSHKIEQDSINLNDKIIENYYNYFMNVTTTLQKKLNPHSVVKRFAFFHA